MASNFIPLQSVSPAAPKRPVPSAPLAPSSAAKDHFSAPNFAPLCAAGTTAADAGQPIITLKKEGDRVVQIRIQCLCGQIIELACDY